MKPIFTITIDTESDDAWEKPETIKLSNLQDLIKFQFLCEKYRIVPTYLMTYEYVKCKKAVEFFKEKWDKGKCEIGMHLHVWSTPPFNEKTKVDMHWLKAYQFELPDELFYEKANNLREAIFIAFGKYPTSNRAGRWGIDQRTIDWLIEKKFLVDTTILPYKNFESSIGKFKPGLNFEKYNTNPFFWRSKKTNNFLLEIPVTVIKRKFMPLNILKLLIGVKVFKKNKFLSKLSNKIEDITIFRVSPFISKKKYSEIISYSVTNRKKVLNLMFHSSELTFKESPYTRNKENHKLVWDNINHIFKSVTNYGLISKGISECESLIKKNKDFKNVKSNYEI